MPTLTGQNARTISGYVVTLLEFPRWIIERDVDFTNCDLGGGFEARDTRCASCQFGRACCWLNRHCAMPTASASLPDLIDALQTAVDYLRGPGMDHGTHQHDCYCDTCEWLREARGFLRTHRHHAEAMAESPGG